MNRIFKVIYNRTMQRYEVVSELAKNVGRISVTQKARHCGEVFRKAAISAVFLAVLLRGGWTTTALAADIHDGDTIVGGTNITVAKDSSNVITVSANGLATQADLNTVDGKVNTNTAAITANTNRIAVNETNIAANTSNITANTNSIATNTTRINTNASSITANMNRIITLETLARDLGLDAAKPGVKYFRANSTGTDASATGDDAIAIGESARASRTESMAIGKESNAAARNSLALGLSSETTLDAEGAVAIGRNATTGAKSGMTADEGGTTVLVNGGKDSISIGTNANARGNATIALGESAVVMNDSVNGVLIKNSMAIGTDARTVAADNATAIGYKAKVAYKSHSAVALGDNAYVGKEAEAAIAIGKGANANGADSFVAGTTAKTEASNTIAIGSEAFAGAQDSVVLGTKAGTGMAGDTLGTKGSHVVIGNEAGNNVNGVQNIAIGYKAGSNVSSDHNIAIGSNSGSNIGSVSSGNPLIGKNVSIGDNANAFTSLTAVIQATAVGSETKAVSDAVAVGYKAIADGDGSMALGFDSKASDSSSMALGHGARASGGNIAVGSGSVADSTMISGTGYLTGQTASATVVSVGSSTSLRRIVNVADGAHDQDAVTVAQLRKSIDETVRQVNANITSTTATGVYYDTVTSGDGDSITLKNNNNKGTKIHNVAAGTLGTDAVNVDQLSTAVRQASTHYYSVNSTDTNNYNNDGASGVGAMAAGPGAKALGDNSVAAGNNVEAEGTSSIALGTGYGDGSGILTKTVADTGYSYNTAIGAGAQAAGNSSLALGTRAVTAPKNGTSVVDQAIAIGYFAGASDNKAVAVGSEAKSSGKSATAIGDSAQSTGNNSLAIGTEAKASGESSGAIGTKNTVSGANTYVIGSENYTNTAAPVSTGQDISATDSGVFGNQNALEGSGSRITGNRNSVKRGPAAGIEEIMLTGNNNTVAGDPTASVAGKLSMISVYGSGNTVQNAGAAELKNVTIVGNDNKVNASGQNLSDTQILGSNVMATQGNSVYLGSGSAYVTSDATTRGMSAYPTNGTYQYAGGTPAGVVTVGSVGKERRIQNVAAGLVGAASTDAVNGSQLYSMTRPLRFSGDNSTIGATAAADVNVLHRGSDQAMSILGGADGSKLSDNNIGVVADAANNKINVKLAKELKDLTSVTTVDGGKTTTMDGSGVTSTDGTNTTTTTAAGVVTTDGTSTTTVNATGVTITPSTGDPGQTVSLTNDGLSNGGNKITNVAAGVADTDAVNVSQLKGATSVDQGGGFGLTAEDGQSVKKDLGKTVSVVGDGKNIETKVVDGKVQVQLKNDINVNSVTAVDGGKSTTMNGSGVTSTDGTNTTTTTSAGVVTTDGTSTTTVNATGVTITPSTGDPSQTVSLTNDGLNNGGNKIVNVADGEISATSTDAVNGSQIHQLSEEIKQQHTAVTVNGGTAAPAAGAGGAYGDYTSDGNLQLAKKQDANGKITYDLKLSDNLQLGKNGENGQPGTNGTIGINGSGGKSGVGIDGNNGISVKGADGKDGVTIKGEPGQNGTEGHIGLTGAPGKDGQDATADIHVIQGQNGVDGTDGANGTDGMDRIVYEDHNGITHEVATMDDGLKFGANSGTPNPAANKLNSTVNIVGEGTKVDTEYSGTNIKTTVSQANGDTTITVKMDKNLSNIDSIAINGKDGAPGTEGAIGLSGKDGISIKGKDGKDAVSIKGKDGKDAVSIKGEDGIGTIGLNGKDGVTTIRTEKGEPGVDGADGITRIIYKDPNGQEHQGATLDDGMKYSGDTGAQLKKKLNENVNIKGGISDESKLSDGNIGVVSDGTDTLNVKLAKEISGLTSVTTETLNATTVNGGTVNGDTINATKEINVGGKTYINNQGINANDQKITHVAPGEVSPNSTDAVNGSQLHQTNQAINRVGNRVNKVGAGAAALAALHPLDFDPDDKWNVAAGYGNYKSEHAAAVGAFYRPDENVMFSLGATVGNGNNMVNAGVTFALDGKNRITRSRTAMAQEIVELRSLVTQMAARMDRLDAAAGVRTEMFPDVPANHWAYEYVDDLMKRGIVEGYPNGLFQGDRSMTRYEFAAMLDRAVRKGFKLDSKLAKEFEPELGRIYVERISGGDDDRNKIERVRVVNEDEKTRDVYGSKIKPVQVNAAK